LEFAESEEPLSDSLMQQYLK
jgi:hypothetical protein